MSNEEGSAGFARRPAGRCRECGVVPAERGAYLCALCRLRDMDRAARYVADPDERETT